MILTNIMTRNIRFKMGCGRCCDAFIKFNIQHPTIIYSRIIQPLNQFNDCQCSAMRKTRQVEWTINTYHLCTNYLSSTYLRNVLTWKILYRYTNYYTTRMRIQSQLILCKHAIYTVYYQLFSRITFVWKSTPNCNKPNFNVVNSYKKA